MHFTIDSFLLSVIVVSRPFRALALLRIYTLFSRKVKEFSSNCLEAADFIEVLNFLSMLGVAVGAKLN